MEYETGISLPLYVKILNGRITNYQFISEENKDSLVHKMQTTEFFFNSTLLPYYIFSIIRWCY